MNFKQWLESVGMVSSSGEALRALGLKPGATENEITKAHRKLSLLYHPDRGGSKEKQTKINAAFDFLKELGFQTSSRGPEWRSSESPDVSQWSNATWTRHRWRNDDLPPWQTDERSTYNQVGRDRRNVNYCKKEIYDKAMENGGQLGKYTIDAFDGRFFRGIFSVYCNPQTLGFAGEVMEDWNSKGANSYETYAVFASKNRNKLMLIRLKGKDVSHMNITFEDADVNSLWWRDHLKKELDEI